MNEFLKSHVPAQGCVCVCMRAFATTWMRLDFMLTEISQADKDKYCMILYVESKIQTHWNRELIDGCLEVRVGVERDKVVKGYRLLVAR